MNQIFAEDVNFWQTSRTSPDNWMEKAKNQIENFGGKILMDAYGNAEGKVAFLLAFEIEGMKFKINWPVLESKSGNHRAARIQAATMLYHDVKSKCLKAVIFGPRVSFLEYLLLPNGLTAGETSEPALMNNLPKFITFDQNIDDQR